MSNLKKYGVEYLLQGADINKQRNEKSKQTTMAKYSETSYSKIDQFKQKVKETNRKKYGKDYFTQTDEYIQKTMNFLEYFKFIELGCRI